MEKLHKCIFCGCIIVECTTEEEAIEAFNNRVSEAEIREKAISEAVEKMKRWICVTYGLSDIDLKEIDEIADKLKAGE